jgi:hypothetical protein
MNASLPDEIQALKALVLEQQDELAAREAEIEHLKFVIAKLPRPHGRSRVGGPEPDCWRMSSWPNTPLPLYRQSEIYAREGVELSRSTLSEWVGQCHALLRPLIDQLQSHVLAAGKLHTDDTPVPGLAPGQGQTRTGRLGTYVRDDRPWGDATPPAVWFAYSPNRRGEHPQAHLRSFAGILQADAFAGYAPLYGSGKVREAACWAPVRRKFHELAKAQASPLAAEALQRIRALYAIEKDIRGKPPDLRRAERAARAGPLLADFQV